MLTSNQHQTIPKKCSPALNEPRAWINNSIPHSAYRPTDRWWRLSSKVTFVIESGVWMPVIESVRNACFDTTPCLVHGDAKGEGCVGRLTASGLPQPPLQDWRIIFKSPSFLAATTTTTEQTYQQRRRRRPERVKHLPIIIVRVINQLSRPFKSQSLYEHTRTHEPTINQSTFSVPVNCIRTNVQHVLN